ncbi:MAG: ArsC/Spx/MgsR family protein [Sphaerochaetaceae bacterium]|jgi:arsenate reductase
MIQIIGTKQCVETKKAVRFCQERSIVYQFVDLKKVNLSEGEWKSIFCQIDGSQLIDTSSSYYQKEGYQWRSYDAQEELRLHSELLKTPLLRAKGKVVIGFDPLFFKQKW